MKFSKEFLTFAVLALTLAPIQNAGAWGQFDGGHHPDYNRRVVRRDPVIVHRDYVAGGGGCVGCGVGAAAVAGLIGGAILGASIAGNSAPPPTIVEQAPPQIIVQQVAPAPGIAVAGLPPGCSSMNVNGANYFQCGPTWYQPYVGGNGVYYVVVPTP